ncbi:hypothetical protein [Shewanella xiamenensis]|uniref:hypothetical protein n=1 Tax=Shewanella xiamenensis TaxID=332186 RepID=UPI001558F8B9|nr:hypothetical protein [Shewanella xiamenensis]
MTKAHGKHHIALKQEVHLMNGLVVPVLYLRTQDGIRACQSLMDYFLQNSERSIQWMQWRVRAVGFFYDYCQELKANGLFNYEGNEPSLHRKVMRMFLFAFMRGTIDHKTAKDPLKLYWPAATPDVTKRLASALEDFIDFCHVNDLIDKDILQSPERDAMKDEPTTLTFLYRAIKIKQNSFLSHVKNIGQIAQRLERQNRRSIININTETSSPIKTDIRFPQELVAPFFKYGFVKDPDAPLLEDQNDITGKMAALLLFFGGLRMSEPLHLWVNDIVLTSQYGHRVFLRHPEQAETFIIGEKKTREAYLKSLGLQSRRQSQIKSYHAGWKNLAVDQFKTCECFFLHQGASDLFASMYGYYINNYRPKMIATYKNNGNIEHPFLFVSSGFNRVTGESYVGAPYSEAAFDYSWEQALNRVEHAIGEKIPRGKRYGTTKHGGRHFYGGLLSDVNAPPKVIQACLHHGSIESQERYKAPTIEGIQAALNEVRSLVQGIII